MLVGEEFKQEYEIMKEIERYEKRKQRNKAKEDEKDVKEINLDIQCLELTKSEMCKQKAICHTYFIENKDVKNIDWRQPQIKRTTMETVISVAKEPFADGAMRYAFYARDVVD